MSNPYHGNSVMNTAVVISSRRAVLRTSHPATRQRTAFTLVELLVVIAIIGILVAMLLPAVQSAREAARRTSCVNNFKQASLALQMYHDARKTLPVGTLCTVFPNDPGIPSTAKTGLQGMSWSAHVLPYMEEGGIFNLIDNENAVFSGGTWKAGGMLVTTYICPTLPHDDNYWTDQTSNNSQDGSAGHDYRVTNITGNMGYYPFPPKDPYPARLSYPTFNSYQQKAVGNGMFMNYNKVRFKQVSDGLSKTLLVGETTGHRGRDLNGEEVAIDFNWMTRNIQTVDEGINGPFTIPGGRSPSRLMGVTGQNRHEELVNQFGFSSYHPGGAHFAMCDGSVTFLSQDINQAALEEMASRDGGGIIP